MKRSFGLDLVRTVAILFVISVHFVSYCGYYSTAIVGIKLTVFTGLRWLFFTCVPLFMLLTGFLQNKKALSKKYYLGITKVLFVYVVSSILCLACKAIDNGEPIGIFSAIKEILAFRADPYSWYVNMFIGLFLLIPFLNLIYNSLNGLAAKLTLIFTFLFLTACSTTVLYVFPSFWEILYPITYYFLGAFIYEYKIKVKKSILIVSILLLLIIQTVLTIHSSAGGPFSTVLDTYGSLPTVVTSVLVFLLLYDVETKNVFLHKAFASISDASFGMYLISWIFDTLLYPFLRENVSDIGERLYFAPVMIFAVFSLSYAVSLVLNLLYRPIGKAIKKIKV